MNRLINVVRTEVPQGMARVSRPVSLHPTGRETRATSIRPPAH